MRALGGREGGSSGRAFIFRVPRKKEGQKPQRNRGPWLLSPSFIPSGRVPFSSKGEEEKY